MGQSGEENMGLEPLRVCKAENRDQGPDADQLLHASWPESSLNPLPLLQSPRDSTGGFLTEVLGHAENVVLISELMKKNVNHVWPVVKQKAP